MKKGELVNTPRFCNVRIQKVFREEATARKQGFTEPTYYAGFAFGVLGKVTGLNTMIFAAYKK